MMSDRIRQSLAFVIAMGMVIAVVSAPTLAQVTGSAIEIAAASGNADKVDGRHAVGWKTSKAKRAGKLVATNSSGYLPANIVKPYWGAIKNKPAGFADGVDNVGVARIKITYVTESITITAGTTDSLIIDCPAGKVVGGGFGQFDYDVRIADSRPVAGVSWWVEARNLGASNRTLDVYAICMSTTPSAALASKGSVKTSGKK